MNKKRKERKPNIENVKKCKEYRAKGLLFREIAMLMKKKNGKPRDLGTLARWNRYELADTD